MESFSGIYFQRLKEEEFLPEFEAGVPGDGGERGDVVLEGVSGMFGGEGDLQVEDHH